MTGGASAPLARPIPPTRNQKCSKSGGEKARSLPCASAPPPQFNLFNESPHEYDGLTNPAANQQNVVPRRFFSANWHL
jgi:hypothetical protein